MDFQRVRLSIDITVEDMGETPDKFICGLLDHFVEFMKKDANFKNSVNEKESLQHLEGRIYRVCEEHAFAIDRERKKTYKDVPLYKGNLGSHKG